MQQMPPNRDSHRYIDGLRFSNFRNNAVEDDKK